MWRFNSIIVLVFIWLGDRSRFNKSCLHDLGVPNHHCYRVSSQFLVKFISLWIIKSFWSIYLQDNYHFKDLNIKKNGLIFRIQIKNASKCNFRSKIFKKGVQIGPKLKRKPSTQEGLLALLECRLAQILGSARELPD